jgi:3-dehydroquinate dehydratase-1
MLCMDCGVESYSAPPLAMAAGPEHGRPDSWPGIARPLPVPKTRSIIDIHALLNSQKPALLVVFGHGQADFIGLVGHVLGQAACLVTSRREAQAQSLQTVVGISLDDFTRSWTSRDQDRVVINAHCVDGGQAPDPVLTSLCHYEYLYTTTPFDRRDLTRYLSFILGQFSPHRDLSKKERTTLISTTFPDVNAALPNLEILSVGADAIELRVDLLKEPLPDGSFNPIPSLKYVGEQVMILRRRSELPIIYTTRCTEENGRFPMDDPQLFFTYLYKAIQWGVEYIDVELWLPEDIRRRLSDRKGSSKIISAFHDFSGKFKWTSEEAQDLFRKGAVFGDVVKMIVYVHSMQENYELEHFRSIIQAEYSHPPLSGLNMGRAGQISRCFNKIFTPITHPLLPMIAAPGQLSAAEINQTLHSMGEMPKLDFYGIGNVRSASQAMFFEKCFNELSLPHQFILAQKDVNGSIDAFIHRPNFGGAYLNPPLCSSKAAPLSLSNAANVTGLVDTLVMRTDGGNQTMVGENAAWKGIRATLTRDFLPSAYINRAALVLANSEQDAASVIFALKSLDIGSIYTIGFRATHGGSLAADLTPVRAIDDLKQLQLEQPFVLVSALPADKALLVAPLLKHYGNGNGNGHANEHGNGDGTTSTNGSNGAENVAPTTGRVFVDLANGPKKGDPIGVAASMGWTAYGIDDVSAWTAVETLKLLVGQNVPYDFVRLASGRTLF